MQNLQRLREGSFTHGIPDLTKGEFVGLISLDVVDDEEDGMVLQLGAGVIECNPYLKELIEADLEYWFDSPASEVLSRTKMNEYGIGIREGYELVFGSMGYMAYVASGSDQPIDAYLRAEIRPGHDLYVDEETHERILRVLDGDALMQDCIGYLESSADLPDLHEQEVFSRNKRYGRFIDHIVEERRIWARNRYQEDWGDIVETEIDIDVQIPSGYGHMRYEDDDDEYDFEYDDDEVVMGVEASDTEEDDLMPNFDHLLESYEEGFHHGVDHAIEALIQMNEQQLLHGMQDNNEQIAALIDELGLQ